jgi:flagellar hook assembly protein FlgD
MAIYDMLGNRVAELVNEQQNVGVHEVTWNGSDEKGRQVSSGVYLLTINAGSTVQSKKMILLK